MVVIPTPIEGEGGGGQNQPVEFHFFSWKPWDSDPIAQMEFWSNISWQALGTG